MKTLSRVEKEVFWRRQLADQKKFSGTQVEFCRERSICRYQFQYWKRQLGGQLGSKESSVQMKPFARVEVEHEGRERAPEVRQQAIRLPEARWVAEVMSHLIRELS